MNKYKPVGWKMQSQRHSLAAKGVKTKVKWQDKLKGGLADGCNPEDFDKVQLVKGIKVEREHTKSRHLAEEIVMDHLTEDSKYYDKLEKMEKTFRKER